nr:immunoglobulin heavy chain junction region [Mus musculus]
CARPVSSYGYFDVW